MQVLLLSTQASVERSTLPTDGVHTSDPPVTASSGSGVALSAVDGAKDVTRSPASDNKLLAAVKPADIEQAIKSANGFFQQVNRELRFQHSKATNEMVVQIVDQQSGKIIQQFPSEQMLKIAKDLENVSGLLFKGSA